MSFACHPQSRCPQPRSCAEVDNVPQESRPAHREQTAGGASHFPLVGGPCTPARTPSRTGVPTGPGRPSQLELLQPGLRGSQSAPVGRPLLGPTPTVALAPRPFQLPRPGPLPTLTPVGARRLGPAAVCVVSPPRPAASAAQGLSTHLPLRPQSPGTAGGWHATPRACSVECAGSQGHLPGPHSALPPSQPRRGSGRLVASGTGLRWAEGRAGTAEA